MLRRGFSTDDAAKLQAAALSPVAKAVGLDYFESFFEPPETDEELAFQAMRCGAELMVAFADPDGWIVEGRPLRRLARRGANRLQRALAEDSGRDAISWVTQSYGRVMASARRNSMAEAGPEKQASLAATADMDEWLAELAGALRPVDPGHPAIGYAFEVGGPLPAADPEPAVKDANDRLVCAIQAICLATWPRAEELAPVFLDWATSYEGLTMRRVVNSDWLHVAAQWTNLLDPSRRRSYREVMVDSG